MAKCAVCGKGAHFGNNVSHSHRRSNRMFKSNIKSVRCVVNGGTKTQYVCARCLKSGKVERAQFSLPLIYEHEKKGHGKEADTVSFFFYPYPQQNSWQPISSKAPIRMTSTTVLSINKAINMPTAIQKNEYPINLRMSLLQYKRILPAGFSACGGSLL